MLDSEPYAWDDPPERIAACLSCGLGDCKPTHPGCNLRHVTVVKTRVAAHTIAAQPKICRSALTVSIRQVTGQTVGEWCKRHKIKYEQLHRYEWHPPKEMTKLRMKIESALQKDGIPWIGLQHSTHY